MLQLTTSYFQCVGYKQEKPEDFSDLYSLAKTGANALSSVNGVDYLIGTIPELLYVASGVFSRFSMKD